MKKNGFDKQKRLFELIDQLIGDLPKLVRKGNGAPKAAEAKTRHDFEDVRTGAKITHVHLELRDFIKVSSLNDNFFQRKLQNHLTDKIYKNLIISILQGHLIPELRVAVLMHKSKVTAFDKNEFLAATYKVSIIDGLQRYGCFLIAMFLAARGQDLVTENIISPAVYKEFEQYLGVDSLEKVLASKIRLEVYYNLEIKDLLKYMIIFNTAQRRMSLNHQLEIMEGTILQNLKENHKANFIRDTDAGSKKNQFTGADLVLAIQAYLQQDHTISKNATTDDLFHSMKSDDKIVDDKIDEICKGISLITNKLHPVVKEFYEETEESKYMNILPGSTSQFMVPMMASLGTYTEREGNDQKLIVRSINRILNLYKEGNDVFELEEYYKITDEIKSSRGATIKNMAERAFRDFWFDKTATSLNWQYAYKTIRNN